MSLSFSDHRKRTIPFVALFGIGLAACAAFVGPSTTLGPDYYVDCGDGVQCRRDTQTCSKTKPQGCIDNWVYGAARDAGSDR